MDKETKKEFVEYINSDDFETEFNYHSVNKNGESMNDKFDFLSAKLAFENNKLLTEILKKLHNS